MKWAYHLFSIQFSYIVVCLLVLSMLVLAGSCNKSNAAGSQFHTSPDKWKKPRIYHTEIDPFYDQKISVAKIGIKETGKRYFPAIVNIGIRWKSR